MNQLNVKELFNIKKVKIDELPYFWLTYIKNMYWDEIPFSIIPCSKNQISVLCHMKDSSYYPLENFNDNPQYENILNFIKENGDKRFFEQYKFQKVDCLDHYILCLYDMRDNTFNILDKMIFNNRSKKPIYLNYHHMQDFSYYIYNRRRDIPSNVTVHQETYIIDITPQGSPSIMSFLDNLEYLKRLMDINSFIIFHGRETDSPGKYFYIEF